MTVIISTESEDDAGTSGGDDLLTWILAWSELVAFGALLVAFVIVSWLRPDEFAAGKARLHHIVPLANTVVLLVSGWFAANALSQKLIFRKQIALLAAAAGGLLFVALKFYEYRIEGASLVAEDAFTQLYMLLTGFHLAHVVFGSLVLMVVARFPTPQNVHLITTLWHVIDVVWLVMFPVVYLL